MFRVEIVIGDFQIKTGLVLTDKDMYGIAPEPRRSDGSEHKQE